MLNRRQAIPMFQSKFYERYYRLFLHLSLLMVVLMCILMGIIFFLLLVRSEPAYYANSPDGKIFLMSASDRQAT